jgi:hypothetical protein
MRTHVELRLVWPVLAPDRHELFAARELRVEQRLERVVKYMRHFARRGAQAVQDRHVVQERDYGRDDYLVLRDEQVERADRVDMWGVQWECDFLIRLPELMREGAMLEHTDTQERTEGLTAVSITSPSSLSTLPPGKAVCPGCERSSFDRVVNRTWILPARSYNKMSTAASLEDGCGILISEFG